MHDNDSIKSGPGGTVMETLPPKISPFKRFLRIFLKRKVVVISLIVLFIVILAAIFAPLISPYDPIKTDLKNVLQHPSPEHPLGTDALGRDELSRVIFGARVSLLVGLVSVVIAGSIGMLLGLVAGISSKWISGAIMRFVDALMAAPLIIMALFLASALGTGMGNVMLAVGIAMMPTYVRITRGQVISIKNSDYVLAGTLSGAGTVKNAIVHILPNCISPLIVLMTMNLGIAILAEAALSFLGMGVNPPRPTWGAMISDGYAQIRSLPVLSIAPGVVIILVVLAFNIVGDALRDTLDPRLRGSL